MTSARNQYEPSLVFCPGETLAEILDEKGWTQAELARRMQRPVKTINEIVRGKASITPETALQLERTLGASATFWINSEGQYQEYKARMKERTELESFEEWIQELPLKEMIRNDWIKEFSDTAGQVREILQFFGVATRMPWDELVRAPAAAFRAAKTFDSRPAALAAWLRMGEIAADRVDTEPYNELGLRMSLPILRALTTEAPDYFVEEIQRRCASCGVAVVFVPEITGVRVSGAARWLTDGRQYDKAIVQLTLRYKTNDHLWFTFFHEVGHILLHGKRAIFIDFEMSDNPGDRQEREANEFAANLLIPASDFRELLSRGKPSEQVILAFAAKIGIHAGIVVGRLQFEKVLPWNTRLNQLKERLRWN